MRPAVRTPAGAGRLLAVLAAVVVLGVLALGGIAAHGGSWAAAPPPSVPTAGALPTPRPSAAAPTSESATPTPDGERSNAGAEVATEVVLVAVAVLSLGGLGLLLGALTRPRWRRRPGRRHATPDAADGPETARESLSAAVGRALDLVEDRPDAQEAVIQAWLLLGTAAAAAGTPARPAETSAEYAGRLAADHSLPGAAVQRLAELYREARFSTHLLRPEQREEARAALRTLRAALAAEHGSAAAPR